MAEGKIRKHYSHKIADERQKQKCMEAENRQAIRDKRPDVEQIVLIRQRPGSSKKELARLERK